MVLLLGYVDVKFMRSIDVGCLECARESVRECGRWLTSTIRVRIVVQLEVCEIIGILFFYFYFILSR